MKNLLVRIISSFLIQFFKIRYGKKIIFGKKIIINHKFKFRGKGKLIISDNANLWAHEEQNRFFTYSPEAVIQIGKNTRLNGVTIQSRQEVFIGENCLIGSCIILDTDFHSIFPEKRNDPNFIKTSPVKIGDKVWIAGQTAILKGVTVEKEVVIGFRAVVTRNVPARTVVAGNPAKVIKNIPNS